VNLWSKISIRIVPIWIFLSIQAILSSVVGFFYGRSRFWPGIDALPVLEKSEIKNHDFLISDLFTVSSSQKSGRSPYLFFLKTISTFFGLTPVECISLLSAFTICFATSLVLLVFFFSGCISPSRERLLLSPLQVLLLSIPTATFPRVFLIPGITLSGYDPFVVPWVRPEMIAIVLVSAALIIIRRSLTQFSLIHFAIATVLVFLGCLIHPSVTLFYFLMWAILKTSQNSRAWFGNFVLLVPIALSFLVLRIFFYSSPPDFSSENFVDIYANWRHPHHFWPSYYLTLNNVLLVSVLILIVYSAARLSKQSRFRNLWMVFSLWFIGTNLLQYIASEALTNSLLTLLGPSRGNLFFLLALYAVTVQIISSSISERIKVKNSVIGLQRKQNIGVVSFGVVLTILVSSLSVLGSYEYVKYDFRKYAKEVKHVTAELNLGTQDLVLVDPVSIDTTGWREFSGIQIYIDSYFMFDLKSIQTYRTRWIEICGQSRLSHCEYSLKKMDEDRLECFLKTRNISKIVFDRRNDVFEIEKYSSFKSLGRSGNYIAYLVPTSSGKFCNGHGANEPS
jgi:hypothetical protein